MKTITTLRLWRRASAQGSTSPDRNHPIGTPQYRTKPWKPGGHPRTRPRFDDSTHLAQEKEPTEYLADGWHGIDEEALWSKKT